MSDERTISVILPAAGQSKRFGAGKQSKLDQDLNGRTVLVRAVALFSGRPEVAQVLVAVPPRQVDEFKLKWGDKLGFLGATIVPGGEQERWETVARALEAVDATATHVAVHDAARPLASKAMVDRVFAAAEHFPAVVPALPVSETLKRAEDEPSAPATDADPLDAILGSAGKIEITAHKVIQTVSRQGLWAVQTPQVFSRALLNRAYAAIASGSVDTGSITDDAGLVERLGEPVYLVAGERRNLKITRAEDMALARAILSMDGEGGSAGLGAKRKFPTWAESEED